MSQLPPRSLTQPSYMASVDSLFAAHCFMAYLDANTHRMTSMIRDTLQVDQDKCLLDGAVPFAWSKETMEAVLAASQSIPKETRLDRWNLPVRHLWWHFEEPLPWCPSEPVAMNTHITALSLGWIDDRQFGITAWIRDVKLLEKAGCTVSASQSQWWRLGESLEEMLRRLKFEHWALFGPIGKYRNEVHTSHEKFLSIAEGLARFILAALSWLEQKVLVEETGHIERHRRKELERKLKVKGGVRVIQLRRSERAPREGDDAESQPREWSHRWLVSGHWRLQPCGPARTEKRLTWITPYIKGPDDKPFQASTVKKVYVVNR